MSIQDQLHEFISKKLVEGESPPLTHDQDLFTSGILDSLNFVFLVQFLHKQWKIKFSPSELLFENFDTINKIAQMVQQKNPT